MRISIHIVPLLFRLFPLPLSLFGFLIEVAVVVEVAEKSDEAEGICQHHHVHGVRKVAVSNQVVNGVDGDSEKLQLMRNERREK